MRTGLINVKRSIVAPDIEISEAPLQNDAASVGRKTFHMLTQLLLPAVIRVELDLR